jgi:hypothetical protein
MKKDDPILIRMKDRLAAFSAILGRHPAAPLMGRVVVYWALIAFILLFVVATSNTPIHYVTVIGGAIAVSILVMKIRRRLNATQRILARDEDRPKKGLFSLFAQIFSYLRNAKKIIHSQKPPPK